MASQTGLGFHLLSTGSTLWIATDQWAYEYRPEDEGCVRTRDVRMLFTLFFSSRKHPHPDPDNFSCLRQSRGPAGPLTRMRSANHRRHPLGGAGEAQVLQVRRQVQPTGARAPPLPRLSWAGSLPGGWPDMGAK